MPHFVLEYSDNVVDEVDFDQLFGELHAALVAAGPFQMSAIKSRAVKQATYRVADGKQNNAFVHLTLSILSGRGIEEQKEAGKKIFNILQNYFPRTFKERATSITLEVREINQDTYCKASSIVPG